MSSRASRLLARYAYGSLIVLLGIELLTHYDTWVRQVALSITDVIVLIALIIFGRQLAKRAAIMPWPVAWAAAAGVWFDAMGNFIHFYARFGWWDKVAHGVASGALAFALLILLQTLTNQGRIRLGRFMLGLYAVCITTTLSVLYEISEYIGDSVYPTNRVTGLFDTSDDLMWNTLAAVLVVVIILAVRKKKRESA